MKYSDYINNVHFKHKSISYNLLTKNSSESKKIKVTGQQAFNLIKLRVWTKKHIILQEHLLTLFQEYIPITTEQPCSMD